MKDPYEILGVRPDANADELKKAFRRRARECHPDSDPDNPWAEDEFKEISGAYGLLSDKHLRARYDRGEISGDGVKRLNRCSVDGRSRSTRTTQNPGGSGAATNLPSLSERASR